MRMKMRAAALAALLVAVSSGCWANTHEDGSPVRWCEDPVPLTVNPQGNDTTFQWASFFAALMIQQRSGWTFTAVPWGTSHAVHLNNYYPPPGDPVVAASYQDSAIGGNGAYFRSDIWINAAPVAPPDTLVNTLVVALGVSPASGHMTDQDWADLAALRTQYHC